MGGKRPNRIGHLAGAFSRWLVFGQGPFWIFILVFVALTGFTVTQAVLPSADPNAVPRVPCFGPGCGGQTQEIEFKPAPAHPAGMLLGRYHLGDGVVVRLAPKPRGMLEIELIDDPNWLFYALPRNPEPGQHELSPGFSYLLRRRLVDATIPTGAAPVEVLSHGRRIQVHIGTAGDDVFAPHYDATHCLYITMGGDDRIQRHYMADASKPPRELMLDQGGGGFQPSDLEESSSPPVGDAGGGSGFQPALFGSAGTPARSSWSADFQPALFGSAGTPARSCWSAGTPARSSFDHSSIRWIRVLRMDTGCQYVDN